MIVLVKIGSVKISRPSCGVPGMKMNRLITRYVHAFMYFPVYLTKAVLVFPTAQHYNTKSTHILTGMYEHLTKFYKNFTCVVIWRLVSI